MSTYVEITNGINESEFGAVEITPEGDAIVKTGSFSHGQGHETTFAQIAAAQMGLPVERVTVIKGDTDRVARGTGTYGSKSTQIGGAAARQAADELVEKAKELAAEQLEADPQDMVLELGAGTFHVAGAPQPSLDWSRAGRATARRPAGCPSSASRPTSRPSSRRFRSARTWSSSRSTRRRARWRCGG